jgi:DNA-binding response OmpR family regulator
MVVFFSTCRVVGDLSSALILLGREEFGSILVNGVGIPMTDLANFVADAADLIDVPVLVMVTPKQGEAETVSACSEINAADWIQLPASLKEIRQRLQLAQDNRAKASALDGQQMKPEANR